MKQCYREKNFGRDPLQIIEQANEIIETYMGQGYTLTLRQLYYQFVSRNLIPNTMKSYKRLGVIISDARLAGLIDWDAIEDRTRNLETQGHWNDPAHIILSAARGYAIDKWQTQPYRVEIWIEKEALAGVFDRVAKKMDVPYFCCRGYTSQSEMRGAAQRLLWYRQNNQTPVILHFGDHDPSGIDMTRDIIDRMDLFGLPMEVKRLALNMDQVELYEPPPNPAKQTDSRYAGYIREFGNESWELDALEPQVLSKLAADQIANIRDEEAWREALEKETEERTLLNKASERWEDIVSFVIDSE